MRRWPAGSARAAYLENLKWVSKSFIILEPVSPERTGMIQCQMDGRIYHAWDNWALDYGLKEYRAQTFLENTAVFSSRR